MQKALAAIFEPAKMMAGRFEPSLLGSGVVSSAEMTQMNKIRAESSVKPRISLS